MARAIPAEEDPDSQPLVSLVCAFIRHFPGVSSAWCFLPSGSISRYLQGIACLEKRAKGRRRTIFAPWIFSFFFLLVVPPSRPD